MIVLGERHQFSTLELETLHKKFDSIDMILYRDTDAKKVISEIESYVEQHSKSIILLNTWARIPDELLTYLVKLESRGIRYLSTESFLEQYLCKCYIPEDQTNISFLEKIKPYSLGGYILKRIIDYIGVLILGILTAPVMLYAAYKIRRESPGPVIFRQDRIGLNGREFTCYKFRSMRLDAEKDGAQFASENDSRVFAWGETMRKTRIDELPQLWNVLRGEMHIIGPRPERRHWIEQFEADIPYYHERHLVKPGITGWAQVNYPYGANTKDAKQKLMYDLYYIKYWNLWLEIKTSFLTLMVMKGKRGL
jgi:exopolysaccharide biosynthesis polyprenyl glycosylphosphotransferase